MRLRNEGTGHEGKVEHLLKRNLLAETDPQRDAVREPGRCGIGTGLGDGLGRRVDPDRPQFRPLPQHRNRQRADADTDVQESGARRLEPLRQAGKPWRD